MHTLPAHFDIQKPQFIDSNNYSYTIILLSLICVQCTFIIYSTYKKLDSLIRAQAKSRNQMISDIQEQETEIMINTQFSLFLLIVALLLVPNNLMAAETFELRPYYPTTTLNGMTHPLKEMTSTSEVNGKCKTIYADKGEMIPTSGALAELDTTFIRLELEANKIARVQAQRKLDQEKKTLARYTVL